MSKVEPVQREQVALVPFALLSSAALSLEVLLTKFLAYSVAAMLVPVVLGIALLGFGAAGTLAATYPRLLARATTGAHLAWGSLAFCVTTLISFAALARLTPLVHDLHPSTFALSALLTVPFLAAGWVVAVALSAARGVGRVYAANLFGSAFGCLLPLLLLRALGGERMVVLIAAMGCAAAWLFARAEGRHRTSVLSRAISGALVATLAAAVLSPSIYSPAPEPQPFGQLQIVRDYAGARRIRENKLYDRWNATGRIEVYGYDGVPDAPSPYPFLFYVQDSSAGSSLMRWDGRVGSVAETEKASANARVVTAACTHMVWGQPYFQPRNRVLVIGLGGGMDVQCALYNGASSVTVVEINPDSIEAVRGKFHEWTGKIGSDARVEYRLADGRSFVRQSATLPYDVIQLSGVDTKNASSAGALALSENTLYTLEAFVDYFTHLREGGVLSIVRFSDGEAVRLVNTARAALERIGITDASRRTIALDTSYVRGVMVSKSPFTPDDVHALQRRLTPPPGARPLSPFFYNALGMDFSIPPAISYAPGWHQRSPVADYFAAVAGGIEKHFIDEYPLDVSPTSDDRPFFFDVFKYRDASAFGYPHVRVMAAVFGSVLALAVGLVLLPVWLSRFRLRRDVAFSTAFFACIGLAYLLVEVWLMHRFAMYLGHQVYSLGIVLSALLLSTGIGAAVGDRFSASRLRRVALAAGGISMALLLGHAVLGATMDVTVGAAFSIRVFVSVAYTAILGFCMGLPFPAGLSWGAARIPDAVPWFIGINGFASVLSTLAVVPLSHALGYEAVMIIGGALYGIALLAFTAMERA